MQSMDSMQDLVQSMLLDLYAAERQALAFMPKMAKKAKSQQLKSMFEEHQRHTEMQCGRLEEIFQQLGMKKPPRRATHPVISALAKETEQMMRAGGDQSVIDAAIVMAAQKLEHVEIASYGTAVEFAKLLGEKELAKLLAKNLDEEERTDKKLTKLAKSSINPRARARSN